MLEDRNQEVRNWSDVIKASEEILECLKIVETSSYRLYEECINLKEPATSAEQTKLLKLLEKHRNIAFSTELKMLSIMTRSWRK